MYFVPVLSIQDTVLQDTSAFIVTAVSKLLLQCEVLIRQGLLRRVFAEWQRLCQERDWKTQLATRDNEIKRMDREVCLRATISTLWNSPHTAHHLRS